MNKWRASQHALNRLTFTATRRPPGGVRDPVVLMPVIDGVRLLDLVKVFELSQGFDPAGGYGGLVPGYFNFGDLRTYFRGEQEDQWPRAGHLWVLACECGEAGCWPLTARVVVLNDTIAWMNFAQDHRPGRDYTGFGPLVFDRNQYERAVGLAATEAERDLAGDR